LRLLLESLVVHSLDARFTLRSIVVIFGPPSTISSFTLAVVLMRLAGWPAFSRLDERAMEKQPASAAPMSLGVGPLALEAD
jgi:hypothetical protein